MSSLLFIYYHLNTITISFLLSSRVTLKIEISHTEHSYIIGKGGSLIRQVVDKTKSHIHFPDGNLTSSTEKSNKVSITGDIAQVACAHLLLRDLSPVVFQIAVPCVSQIDSLYIKQVQDKYSVNVSLICKGSSGTVFLKQCEKYKENLLDSVKMILERVGNTTGHVTLQMHISRRHQALVCGPANLTLKSISERSKTRIFFTDINHNLLIEGLPNDVFNARQMLIGALPVQLHFDNLRRHAIKDEFIYNLQEKFGILVILKNKPKEDNVSVIIKGLEKNLESLYAARQELLEFLPMSEFCQNDALNPGSFGFFSHKNQTYSASHCRQVFDIIFLPFQYEIVRKILIV